MKKLSALIVGIVVASAACGGGASVVTGPDLLDYVGSSQITGANPMRFSATVVIANTTTESVSFTPTCPVPRVLVYSTAARTGTPVFDSKVRDGASCSSPGKVTINPGK